MDRLPPTWDAQSVRTISPNIFDWLNMQDVTRNVLIGFIDHCRRYQSYYLPDHLSTGKNSNDRCLEEKRWVLLTGRYKRYFFVIRLLLQSPVLSLAQQ